MPERRRSHRRLELGVVDAVELEFEEQEIAGERGHPFVRVAVELRAAGVAGVGGIEQRRVGHDAPGQVLHRLVGLDRRGQRLARVGPVDEFGQLAAPGLGEQLRFPLGALEIGGEARRIHALVQILEPPLRQLSEVGRRGRRRQGGVEGMERQAHRPGPF